MTRATRPDALDRHEPPAHPGCLHQLVLAVGAAAWVGLGLAAEPAARFTPLDLTPLFNQPHINAFPEAPDGFRGWFSQPEVSVSREDAMFAVTPWRADYATPRTPPDFGAWAEATAFGPETHAARTETRIPFRVVLSGNNVVAFDRNTVPLAKTLSTVGRSAVRIHLLGCAGWYPSGRMGLTVRYADGAVEETGFETIEWLRTDASAVAAFERGHVFHHVVALSHADKAIDSIRIIDTQAGPQLLLVAVTLEAGPAQAAQAPGTEAKAAWQKLADSVVRFDDACIVVRADSEPLIRFAAQELRRYLYRLSGRLLPVTDAPPAGKPVVRLGLDPTRRGESVRLRLASKSELRLEGATPVAVLDAAYTWLEKLGVGFYFGGDTLPPAPVPLLVPGALDLELEPVFRIRGSLPWYNFLNSPTTWNYEDFKFFFDQMAKQKQNFIGFHTYDSEPFAAFEVEGKLRGGEPLVGSASYGWGAVRHLKTVQFGFGTPEFFDTEDFGSEATVAEGDRETRIRRCQDLLRRGLEYARSRGLHTCVGFEVTGDPTDPGEQRLFLERLRQMLGLYPMLDYVWLWQSENLGNQGWPVPAADSGLARLAREHYAAFAYLGRRERIVDAARLTGYVRLAHRFVKDAAPGVRLVISGWGGDDWMHFSDHFVGFDQVLPPDVVFAALDNIDPTRQTGVSSRYGEVRNHEVWPIPWYESDGGGTRRDQWGPQCNVRPFTWVCRDAYAKKAGGLLAIHWRSRGIEEVAAYTAQFAWDPDLTYEEFYHGFAKRCFGGASAAETGALLRELEALGPRWTGGAGQVECGMFEWFSGPDRPSSAKLEALARVCTRFEQLRTASLEANRGGVVDRLDHLLNTARFLTRYDEAALLYQDGGPLEKLLADSKKVEAQALLAKPFLGEAMQAYARTLTTRSELGVLATINVKAYAAYLRLLERAGAESATPLAWPPGPPLVLLPTYSSAYEVGEPVVLKAIVVGAKAVRGVRVYFRRLGETEFRTVEATRTVRATFRAELAGVTAAEGGFEYYIEATDDAGQVSRLPSGAAANLRSATVWRGPGPAAPARAIPAAAIEAVLKPAVTAELFKGAAAAKSAVAPGAVSGVTAAARHNLVHLAWQPASAAAGYHVCRTEPGVAGSQALNLTAACPEPSCEFDDRTAEAERTYAYSVRALAGDGSEGPASEPVNCKALYVPPAEVKVEPGQEVLLALQCSVKGEAGHIADFVSFDRDKTVLQRPPVRVEKVRGYGYCWASGEIGCWADPGAVVFKLLGLTPGRAYSLWLRSVCWESSPRTQRVLVAGQILADTWTLPVGRGPAGTWREIRFTAGTPEVQVELKQLSGINSVVSEILVAGGRE